MFRDGIRRRKGCLAATVLVGIAGGGRTAFAQARAVFDFTQPSQIQKWQLVHDAARPRGSSQGMVVEIRGGDPYIVGPPCDLRPDEALWLRLRLKSEQAGTGQVFYFRANASEENSVRFPVRAGIWEEVRVPLPPLGPGYRFRIDPPGTIGTAVIASLSVELRVLLKEPHWPKPAPPALGSDPLTLRSGDLQLVHARGQLGGFVIRVAGRRMAVGSTRPLIGYLQGGGVRWLDLAEHIEVAVTKEKHALAVHAVARDADGAVWQIHQRFAVSDAPGAIAVETRVTVSQDRSVVFLPMLVVLPGVGSFGEAKGQGLFAGVEYLDNEPSSSEADMIGPASRRQVPDTLKVTFPLMAIEAQDRYVGLIWDKDPVFSALFDSPDRLFGSGGHVMGVLFPGSRGDSNRAEGSLLPYEGERFVAGKPLAVRAMLIGGKGKSVVPAVQQYIALRGLPPLPRTGGDFQGYASRAAAGWLDSKIREGALYRHAYPGSFLPQPAADAALLMDWLARETTNADVSRRLAEASRGAIARVGPDDYNTSAVSHVRYPVESLIFGHVAENTSRAQQIGRSLLARFEPDGSVRYRRAPGHPDYGRTHSAPDANGLTAQVVVSLLEIAAACGDPELIRAGLHVLRALDKFENSVPRGAQTWEVPLHTPDILAAAHLVRAYTLGYELTGEKHLLEQARYWAWTGVPFIYLMNPTSQPVGVYASIAVLGATNWTAPVWLGLPVQWCGLVYADALYRFVRHDPGGPWKRLADGITASGIQQIWPREGDTERQGLLPDSFTLRTQRRNDAAINPGTVQMNALRLFDRPALYDFHAFRASGLLVHAPGALRDVREQPGHISFTIQGWSNRPYDVLIAGLKTVPRVRINGHVALLQSPHQYLGSAGRLILRVQSDPAIELFTR